MDVPVTVRGNLTEDPEVRETRNGQMVQLSVAVNHRRYDRQASDWVDDGVSYPRVAVFGKLAQNVAQSLRKGMPVIVTGTIRERPYETQQGEKRRPWEVKAETVGVDLTYAVVGQVSKPERQSQGQAAYGGQQGHQDAGGGYGGQSPTQGGSGAYSGGQGSGPYGDPWQGQGGDYQGSWDTPQGQEPPF